MDPISQNMILIGGFVIVGIVAAILSAALYMDRSKNND